MLPAVLIAPLIAVLFTGCGGTNRAASLVTRTGFTTTEPVPATPDELRQARERATGRILRADQRMALVRVRGYAPLIIVDTSLASVDSALGEASLYSRYYCGDDFGFLADARPVPADEGVSCRICDVPGIELDGERSWQHASALWKIAGHAPHAAGNSAAQCVRTLWQRALLLRPHDRALRLALARFRLASASALERELAWSTWDTLLDTLLLAGEKAAAASVMADAGSAVLDVALALQQRPATSLSFSSAEEGVRNLARTVPPFSHLPERPRVQAAAPGVPEARYAEQLLVSAAELAPDSARIRRLALVPAAWLDDAAALSRISSAFLARDIADSIAWPARALAAYMAGRYTPGVAATFDSLLHFLPRVDSARYDALDEVLSDGDAQWKFGFLPDVQRSLDLRTWSILDPLWVTTVNEVRLESFARTAAADLRYAIYAGPGVSGSETPAGIMWRRAGPPDPRWEIRNFATSPLGSWQLIRHWPGYTVSMFIGARRGNMGNIRGAFYSGALALPLMAKREINTAMCSAEGLAQSAIACARSERANWRSVPYVRGKDTIDVHLARFRSGVRGGGDVYVAARLPLRGFRAASVAPSGATSNASSASSGNAAMVKVAAWLKKPTGETLFHAEEARKIEDLKGVSWTTQWSAPVAATSFMHRVEALRESTGRSAWGAAVLSAGTPNALATHGFGLSDMLVARTVRPAREPARSWRDLDIQPNAGVVAPQGVLAVAWEMYDLTPDASGRAQWTIDVSLKGATDLERAGFRDIVAGIKTDKRSASGPSLPQYHFSRNAVAQGVLVDYLSIGVSNAEPGRYVLLLTITDRVSGKAIASEVNVRVLDEDAQKNFDRPVRQRRGN